MALTSRLLALVSEETEPARSSYQEAADGLIQDPEQINCLLDDEAKIHLASHSERLQKLFRVLYQSLSHAKASSVEHIAAETSKILSRLLPYLHQLLGDERMAEYITPALNVCLKPQRPRNMRELASKICCGNLLEHLASGRDSSSIIARWISLPTTLALDGMTQTEWAKRLATMVTTCSGDHELAHILKRWSKLTTLLNALRTWEQKLLHMENLNKTGSNNVDQSLPKLQSDSIGDLLKTFGLPIPGSRRTVQLHIETLSSQSTCSILQSIISSFPCKCCVMSLGSELEYANTEVQEDASLVASDVDFELFGPSVGIWQPRLHEKALASLRELNVRGIFNPVKEKILDLASGSYLGQLAGTDEQRKKLRVPLYKILCGRRLFILWQVSIGVGEKNQDLQQIIIIWEVGDKDTISKAIDRAASLQYCDDIEAIARCRQRPLVVDGKRIPLSFGENDPKAARVRDSAERFDIRMVDSEIIQTANRFYALTEPMIHSIMANDFEAHFQFDLSRDEIRCIRHSQTATLILGRSGTGKTTCLVSKMVGKFLASKAVSVERPTHQVLITRSVFLADKLENYTRRQIRTLETKASTHKGAGQDDKSYQTVAEGCRDTRSLLDLTDDSYPLVCTFDHFLQLLENTLVATDRQNFSDVGQGSMQVDRNSDPRRTSHDYVIDFHTFKCDYWPRFSNALTKGLSLHLIYAEIMGVIKGSESSRDSLRPLIREQYISRSSRLAPNFVEAERSRVFDLFEAYEKLKLQHGGVDYVDRVVVLLRAFRQNQLFRQALRVRFDEVYIDEVQDHRSLDIELFLNIVKHSRGLHLAGDTAQAISQDSTFRFSDVKKMIFEHFAPAMQSSGQDQLGHAEMFALSKNYRSHQGILALASLIMEMIWNGFPDTIDKLSPEIGTFLGPKPVLFIGCGIEILLSSSVGSSELSGRSADFGAEQAILVRDADMKRELQHQIGEAALIFTILESKGMEFEDVILWNFFTECAEQSGLRSLRLLVRENATFDSKRYPSMCSELKHLYVAVTRARNQMFIVETSQSTGLTVQRLFEDEHGKSLVEVTRPELEDFSIRVEMMRPSTTVSSIGWAERAKDLMRRRMYQDAIMSFRRAKDQRGEKTAQAYLREEEGRNCRAKLDQDGFMQNMNLASEYFIEVELIDKAIETLVSMDKIREAAELSRKHGQPARAAAFFVKASLYSEAFECYHNIQEYSDAAMILRTQKRYDELVCYVTEYQSSISSDLLRSCSLLWKLLLKQNKLTTNESIGYAVKLLGSLEDREIYFREYGLHRQLAELYTDQKRHLELYRLHREKGKLLQALDLALSVDLLHITATVTETELLCLLDYVWVGYLMGGSPESFAIKLASHERSLTPSMRSRSEQWKKAATFANSRDPARFVDFGDADLSCGMILVILRRSIERDAIVKAPSLNSLPLKLIQEAVKAVRNLLTKEEPHSYYVVWVAMGLWRPLEIQGKNVALSWFPPHVMTMLSDTNANQLQISKHWILDIIASCVFALEGRANELWDTKWPGRCYRFLTKGFCPPSMQAQCNWLHEHILEEHCSQLIEDLLRVNSLFCDLTPLYYRRVMGEKFQHHYLRIRRRWLERLLDELTFLSAIRQSTSVIKDTRAKLLAHDRLGSIKSSLEELLYFRLEKEWYKRNNFSALLEALQVAATFGQNVHNRVSRALSYKLLHERKGSLQRQLGLLEALKFDTGHQPVVSFQEKLTKLLDYFAKTQDSEMLTLHSVTALFEDLASYMILNSCVSACLLTQSWVDMHISQASRKVKPSYSSASSWEQTFVYHQCLMKLAITFATILDRLGRRSPPSSSLLHSGTEHKTILLSQRNLQLLTLIIVNLAAANPPPKGFNEFWSSIRRIFECDLLRARHLLNSTPKDLSHDLAQSMARYHGKDSLILVCKDRKKTHPFTHLDQSPDVRKMEFDQLLPSAPASSSAEHQKVLDTSSADPRREQYSEAEMKAMVKIQRRWRSRIPQIRARRAYILTPFGAANTRYILLSSQCPPTTIHLDRMKIRMILISKGVTAILGLDTLRDILAKLQISSMDCIEHVEIGTGFDELVGNILCRNRKVESYLKRVTEIMSDESLLALVKTGILSDVQEAMEEAGRYLDKAEKAMTTTRNDLENISKGSMSA